MQNMKIRLFESAKVVIRSSCEKHAGVNWFKFKEQNINKQAPASLNRQTLVKTRMHQLKNGNKIIMCHGRN